jgi:hypothetical protein
MPESTPAAAVDPAPETVEVETQIGRSLSAIWERHDGARPQAIDTTCEADVVRCVIEPGTREADGDQAGEEFSSSIDSTAYRNEAMASVGKHTRRTVKALIAKSPSKAKTTNTFILERRRRRN